MNEPCSRPANLSNGRRPPVPTAPGRCSRALRDLSPSYGSSRRRAPSSTEGALRQTTAIGENKADNSRRALIAPVLWYALVWYIAVGIAEFPWSLLLLEITFLMALKRSLRRDTV